MDALGTLVNGTVQERLLELWERTGDAGLGRLVAGRVPVGAEPPDLSALPEADRSDWVGTALMDCFKRTGDPQVFALLHDLHHQSFLVAIRGQLRRTSARVDPQDVLQEVFLNIYRYPNRFVAERHDAFRNWGHRIVRNTVFKSLKGESRRQQATPLDESIGERADPLVRTPFRSAEEAESAKRVDQAYLLWLNLYLVHYQKLSPREQRALRLVEVDGWSYRDAADDLGIKLENLKMVVFRGRRKILRGMTRSLARLGARLDALRERVAARSGVASAPQDQLSPGGARRRSCSGRRSPLEGPRRSIDGASDASQRQSSGGDDVRLRGCEVTGAV